MTTSGSRLLHRHWCGFRRNPHTHHTRHLRYPFSQAPRTPTNHPNSRKEQLYKLGLAVSQTSKTLIHASSRSCARFTFPCILFFFFLSRCMIPRIPFSGTYNTGISFGLLFAASTRITTDFVAIHCVQAFASSGVCLVYSHLVFTHHEKANHLEASLGRSNRRMPCAHITM